MADQATGTAIKKIDENSPAGFRLQLRKNADLIRLPQHISMEAFESVVFSATVQNPDLLKADRQSLLLACLKAAQDGLLPNGRDAALVVFSTRVKEGGDWVSKQLVQYMPMVAGLRSKIFRAVNPKDGKPLIVGLQVGVVYKAEVEGGYFHWERGSIPEVRHRPMLEIPKDECTDEKIIAAYSIAKFADGTESVEVMRRFEIDKVRQCSQTGAIGRTVKYGKDAGKVIEPKGPWVDWFEEMAKKTVMRRHSKVLPMAGDIVIMETADEAREFESASNATALLTSVEPDAPLAVDESHDPATGEIISTNAEPPEPVVHDEEPQDKPRRGRPPKATKDEGQSTEGNATTDQPAAKSEPEPQVSAGATESGPEPAATPATTDPEAAEAFDESAFPADRGEFTPHPAEAKAEEIIGRMNKAEFAVDIERIFDENEADINAMPEEYSGQVYRSYRQNLQRVGAKVPAQ